MSRKFEKRHSDGLPWINPIGGLGDMLMVGGILKQVHDQDPSRRFNMVSRAKYLSFFKGHPAINFIGYPPEDENLLRVDYWHLEKLGPGIQRPYQILARAYGLKTPVEEKLYISGEIDDDPVLYNFIPWKEVNILVSTASDSIRKEMPLQIWHELVRMLKRDGKFVMQVGRFTERPLKNAYSLRGLTTPRELITLIRKCDLVITSDNFIMHAAHLAGKKAVVLWGPTNNEIYGYPEHTHLQTGKTCDLEIFDECISPERNEGGKLYNSFCPMGEKHCMAQIDPMVIYEKVSEALNKD